MARKGTKKDAEEIQDAEDESVVAVEDPLPLPGQRVLCYSKSEKYPHPMAGVVLFHTAVNRADVHCFGCPRHRASAEDWTDVLYLAAGEELPDDVRHWVVPID